MKKIIIILIVLSGIGVFVYFGFIKPPTEADSLLSGTQSKTSAVLGKDISNALNKLGALSLDASLFDDPNFIILVDYKKNIPDQQPYRADPFLPVVADEPALEGGANININIRPPQENNLTEDALSDDATDADASEDDAAPETTGTPGTNQPAATQTPPATTQ
jgi:hypothetical protein